MTHYTCKSVPLLATDLTQFDLTGSGSAPVSEQPKPAAPAAEDFADAVEGLSAAAPRMGSGGNRWPE